MNGAYRQKEIFLATGDGLGALINDKANELFFLLKSLDRSEEHTSELQSQ